MLKQKLKTDSLPSVTDTENLLHETKRLTESSCCFVRKVEEDLKRFRIIMQTSLRNCYQRLSVNQTKLN